jgi:hypothetical protein
MAIAENRSRRARAGGTARPGAGGLAALIFAGLMLAACEMSGSALTPRKTAPRTDRQAKPWAQVSLDSIGFPGVSASFLQIGASMLTVHILDDSHLLVTFSTRDLVPRLADDPKTDDDRMVAAEIVDLPSGKVAARTVWHMHDHARYLWKLGDGRFLVRIGNRLSTMMPLANLNSKDPFERTVFPDQQYRPSVVVVSPGGRLVTLESVVSYVNPDGRAEALLGDVGADRPVTHTVVQFFRMSDVQRPESAGGGSSLQVVAAGVVTAAEPVVLPVDGDGYLWAEETANSVWSMSFNEFGGKAIDLGNVRSSCIPRLQMVSRAEFLALTCQGTDSNVKMASYGLDGRETWEEGMGDLSAPIFAFAPAAARFAMSRATVGVPSLTVGSSGDQGTVAQQEVRVYQNASGDLLLKVDCSPIFKSGENFDLSSDGLMAAVVRKGAIAAYKLPAPGKEDREDMLEVAKFAPPPADGRVSLTRLTAEVAKGGAGAAAASAAATADGKAGTAAVGQTAGGQVEPMPTAGRGAPGSQGVIATAALRSAEPNIAGVAGAARKPPTLLKPGEKPEFGSSNQPN